MNNDRVKPFVNYQQIGASPKNIDRNTILMASMHHFQQLLLVRRFNKIAHRATQPKPRVLRHRYIAFNYLFQACE